MGLRSAITASSSATSGQTASLCHIAIRVEAYRAQNGLTQWHNCQQFGHVWANCKPLPHCNQGGDIQSSEWAYTVTQLPTVRPRLGKLQASATSQLGWRHIELRMCLRSAISASSSATSGQTASLCHIAIRVEVYTAQNGLTQCHNCQQFMYVWANCEHPPRCFVRRMSPVQGVPRESEYIIHPNTLQLSVGGKRKPHPSNCRCCSHAKEEILTKSHRTRGPTTGMVFSSKFTIAGMSLAAGVRGKTEEQHQQPQTHQETVAVSATMEPRVPEASTQHEQQTTGQSVRARNVNILALEKCWNSSNGSTADYDRV
jgi:hypothetical protein